MLLDEDGEDELELREDIDEVDCEDRLEDDESGGNRELDESRFEDRLKVDTDEVDCDDRLEDDESGGMSELDEFVFED